MSTTPFKQLSDNAITLTSTPLTATGVTSVTLASNTNFPTPGNGFVLTLWNGTDPSLDPNMEKVVVTANAAGVLTHSATVNTHTSPTNAGLLDVSSNLVAMQTAINNLEAILAITTGKVLTVTNSVTLSGTDSTTMTLPAASTTLAGLGTVQTFSAKQTFSAAVNYSNNAVTVASNAATVPTTARLTTVTNNAAATVAITISTSGAADGQFVIVRFYDFSAAVQTLSWVNTENGTSIAPTSSNGSTTLPVTVCFQYNGQTTKWRCVGIA